MVAQDQCGVSAGGLPLTRLKRRPRTIGLFTLAPTSPNYESPTPSGCTVSCHQHRGLFILAHSVRCSVSRSLRHLCSLVHALLCFVFRPFFFSFSHSQISIIVFSFFLTYLSIYLYLSSPPFCPALFSYSLSFLSPARSRTPVSYHVVGLGCGTKGYAVHLLRAGGLRARFSRDCGINGWAAGARTWQIRLRTTSA